MFFQLGCLTPRNAEVEAGQAEGFGHRRGCVGSQHTHNMSKQRLSPLGQMGKMESANLF